MNLNKIGLWTSSRAIPEQELPAAAQLAESLGYGALWLGGSPRLTATRPLLTATERIVIATGIVNVWQYDPAELAAEHAELAAEFPDRLLIGIGIGHPEATSEYQKPLAKMRSFLDGIAAAPTPIPKDAMCIAALGPKMLDLSAERTRGTHPYFVPPAHTRFARERLGAGPLLAPELACVVDRDAERARAAARGYAKLYLGLQNYTANLLKFGFTEADIADGGSDRLVDTIVPQGDAQVIAQATQDHLDAGADHVCLQTVGVQGIPEREWIALSEALIG
jgi:probable F420-dependent oxidoreductase